MTTYKIKEARAPYTDEDTATINKALGILAKRLKRPGTALSSPGIAKDYMRLALHGLTAERFDVLYLDVKNRLIAHETPFNGTLTQTSVYPREIVRRAMHHNASSVLFSHNHPSGVCDPSEADRSLTHRLMEALHLVDVRVLDHFVVADAEVYSFAEHGDI